MPTAAFDLGTHTGWALGPAGAIQAGVWDFSPRRHEGGGMRFLRFQKKLDELLDLAAPIEAVYYEEVARHKGTAAAHIYGGLVAVLTATCEVRGIPYSGVPVGQIKKFATGKGNADKPAMVDAAVAAGFHPADDNEADAIHLLRGVLAGVLE